MNGRTPVLCLAALAAGLSFAASEQVEVRVRQTPGGPKLFVDGKRHLPRSVLVSQGTLPRRLTADWQDFDLAFVPRVVGKRACLQFRFEKKIHYGGVERPDGWVRFRNLTVVDDAGKTALPMAPADDMKALRAHWRAHDTGELGQLSFESNGVVRVDVTKPKTKQEGWSLTSSGKDFHVYTAVFDVEAGRTYHARFQAVADREQDFNPVVYQVPGFVGVPISPDPFDDTIRMAKEVGIDIVIPNGAGPSWKPDGSLSFERADALFDRVLAIYPEALIVARFGIRPSAQHFKEHPDWRTQFDDGKTQDDESVSCLPWRDYSARLVDSFARHLMAKYPRNFAGLHIAAHRAGEWLYEDMLCGKQSGFDVHTLAAWRRCLAGAGFADAATAEVPTVAERCALPDPEMVPDPAKERRLILFHRLLNTEMADRILELAEVARKATDGKKLVAFFYGYSYEVANSGPYSGHFALDYLLRRANGNIDFLCGPFSYSDRKYPDTRPVMGPADTMARYGVMWWNEDDTRTYRETNVDALQIQGRTPMTKPQTLASLERNNRQNAQRGHGYWWMDLRGRGWFLDRDLWQVMEKTRPYEEACLMSDTPYAPDVATIVSDENILHRRAAYLWPVHMLVMANQRTFERCGIPTGQYLLEDVVERDIPARVRFYATSWYLTTADRAKLRAQRATRPDLIRVWMWASGYADEHGKGAEKVADATGFRVRPVKDRRYPSAHPLFAVETEPGDEVWARYEDGSAAVVARPLGSGGWEIFHGIPTLEEATIRRILATRDRGF